MVAGLTMDFGRGGMRVVLATKNLSNMDGTVHTTPCLLFDPREMTVEGALRVYLALPERPNICTANTHS